MRHTEIDSDTHTRARAHTLTHTPHRNGVASTRTERGAPKRATLFALSLHSSDEAKRPGGDNDVAVHISLIAGAASLLGERAV